MSKLFKFLLTAVFAIAMAACSSDDDPAFGNISGRVYDYATHEPLAGVQIALTPGSRSISTDASGNFSFSSLESGAYTVTASLKGYVSATAHVNVNIGETARTDIALSSEVHSGGLTLSTSSLSFDKGINELTFAIKNEGHSGELHWRVNLVTVDWLTLIPSEGTLEEGGSTVVKAVINRSQIPDNKSMSTSFSIATGTSSKAVSVLVNNVSGGNENPDSSTGSVTVSKKNLDFGLNTKSMSVTLSNSGNSAVSFSIFETSEYRIPDWLSISPKSGTIPARGSKEIAFTVDRSKMDDSYDVFIVGFDGISDDVDITVSAESEQSTPVEDYSKASVTSCDYRVNAKITGCHRSGSTVTFYYTLTNNGMGTDGTVNDWRIYPPKSMSLISGGTRSVVWTDDGTSYDYPTFSFNGKATSSANVLNTTFPQGPSVMGSVTIDNVPSSARKLNVTLGVYAYPNSKYNMAKSSVEFRNVPIY